MGKRKRCRHGKVKSDCADCNPCPHGKVKRFCADSSGCSALRVARTEDPLNTTVHERCPVCDHVFAGPQGVPGHYKRHINKGSTWEEMEAGRAALAEHNAYMEAKNGPKSARAAKPVAPEIKPDPEIKLEQPEIKPEPEIKQEPFTIRGYFGIGE